DHPLSGFLQFSQNEEINCLQYAILANKENVVKFLTEERKSEIKYFSSLYRTPFFYAIGKGDVFASEMIALHSDNINLSRLQDLMRFNVGEMVIQERKQDLIKLLIDYDVFLPYMKDDNGWSVLDFAVYYGHRQLYFAYRNNMSDEEIKREFFDLSRPNGMNLMHLCLVNIVNLQICEDLFNLWPQIIEKENFLGIKPIQLQEIIFSGALPVDVKQWHESKLKQLRKIEQSQVKENASVNENDEDEIRRLKLIEELLLEEEEAMNKTKKKKSKKRKEKDNSVVSNENKEEDISLPMTSQQSKKTNQRKKQKKSKKQNKLETSILTETLQKSEEIFQVDESFVEDSLIDGFEKLNLHQGHNQSYETEKPIFRIPYRKKLKPKRRTGLQRNLQIKSMQELEFEYNKTQEEILAGEYVDPNKLDYYLEEPELVDFFVSSWCDGCDICAPKDGSAPKPCPIPTNPSIDNETNSPKSISISNLITESYFSSTGESFQLFLTDLVIEKPHLIFTAIDTLIDLVYIAPAAFIADMIEKAILACRLDKENYRFEYFAQKIGEKMKHSYNYKMLANVLSKKNIISNNTAY
ncbi:hypothetical protein ROZALSC1DRAFT_25045, partial [Rozella allomycis CSF55]